MFFKKTRAENNKIGKNDNYDVGNNKNNKAKNIIKNNEINNIQYDPNKVTIELVKNIANLEREVKEQIYVLKDCKNCQIEVNKNVQTIQKVIDNIQEEYDLEKQMESMNIVIYDTSSIIKNFRIQQNKLKSFDSEICCIDHKELLRKINLKREEVKSLKDSLKIIQNK